MSEPKVLSVGIAKSGKSGQIVVPYGEENLDQAISYLQTLKKKKAEDAEVVGVKRVIRCHPLDGAHALAQTLARMYNWSALVPSPGFFGDRPPGMIQVTTAKGDLDIPWGAMEIPGIKGRIETAASIGKGVNFVINGLVVRKDYDRIQEIFDEVEKFVKTNSIYKGNAIKLYFPEPNEEFDPLFEHAPEVLDLHDFDPAKLVLSKKVVDLLERDLFTPLEFAQYCREDHISLKRGILLEGPPGVGKTLTGMWTAQRAAAAGWTFVYIDNCNALKLGIEFALQNQPAVVFAEDIDRANMGAPTDNPDYRTEVMNAIMNIMDGVESKDTELITVLTTNHLDKITPAMRRPGRLDSIISMRMLDEVAVEKLMRNYAGNSLQADIDLSSILTEMIEYSPAVINEIVQRAKLRAIRRSPRSIDLDDIKAVLTDMKEGVQLIKHGRF